MRPCLVLWTISWSSPWSSPRGFEDLLVEVQQKQDAREALLFGHTFDLRALFEEKHSWPLTAATVTSRLTLVRCISWPKNEHTLYHWNISSAAWSCSEIWILHHIPTLLTSGITWNGPDGCKAHTPLKLDSLDLRVPSHAGYWSPK